MARLKTAFNLVSSDDTQILGSALIVGRMPKHKPYLAIKLHTKEKKNDNYYHSWIADKDLERFAVNILKAIKSKYIKNK